MSQARLSWIGERELEYGVGRRDKLMRARTLAFALLGAAAAASSAEAGGFGVREQSAYGQGSSFAGMAAPGDSISAMFWNPAAVTIVDGITLEGDLTGVFPRSELDVDRSRSTLSRLGITGSGGNVGQSELVPAGYFAAPLTDQLYFGMSVDAPYGFSTTSNPPWVGMFSHLDADAKSVNVTPVLGFKLNNMISIAAGVQVEYFDVD